MGGGGATGLDRHAAAGMAGEPGQGVVRTRRWVLGAWEVLPALGPMVAIEITLRTSDLPTTCRRLGVGCDLHSPAAPTIEAAVLPRRARRPVLASLVVVSHWPAGDTCLRRCLLIGHRLRRLEPVLRIGVKRDLDGGFPRTPGSSSVAVRSTRRLSSSLLSALPVGEVAMQHWYRAPQPGRLQRGRAPAARGPAGAGRARPGAPVGGRPAGTDRRPARLSAGRPDGTVLYSLTRERDRTVLRYPGLCDFVGDRNVAEITAHLHPGADRGLVRVLAAGAVIAVHLKLRHELVMHASAVQLDGRALAFVGASGMGKSTLAAVLCRNGCDLVSDDVLRVDVVQWACSVRRHERSGLSWCWSRTSVGCGREPPGSRSKIAESVQVGVGGWPGTAAPRR